MERDGKAADYWRRLMLRELPKLDTHKRAKLTQMAAGGRATFPWISQEVGLDGGVLTVAEVMLYQEVGEQFAALISV